MGRKGAGAARPAGHQEPDPGAPRGQDGHVEALSPKIVTHERRHGTVVVQTELRPGFAAQAPHVAKTAVVHAIRDDIHRAPRYSVVCVQLFGNPTTGRDQGLPPSSSQARLLEAKGDPIQHPPAA